MSFFACTIVTPCQYSPVPLSLRVSLSLYQCYSVQSSPEPVSLHISLRLYQCHTVQSSPVPLSSRVILRLYHCYSMSVFACTIVTPCHSSPVPVSLRVILRLYHCHSASVFACTIVTPCQSSPVPVSLHAVFRRSTRPSHLALAFFISLFNYSIYAISLLSDQLFGFVSPRKFWSGHRLL